MPHVLIVSGSTRSASTNTAACRTAEHQPPRGVTVSARTDLALLPHFDPDDDRSGRTG